PARPDAGATWRPDQLRSGMRLNEYAETARRFVWNELADWYVESAKPRLAASGEDREVARAVLVHAFDAGLRLLHPVVPFITEALWQRLPERAEKDAELLAVAKWPVASGTYARGPEFERARECVEAIRAMRAEYAVAPGKMVHVVIAPATTPALYADEAALVGQLARATVTVPGRVDGPAAHAVLRDGTDVALSLGGLVDVAQERGKIATELEQLEKQLDALRGRLTNEKFISKAPPNVVAAEREKEREWSTRADALRAKLHSFGGG
ncbi:MAG TPA: class I tRNA ligase family protein, partial [Candidatus Elarobacter sp.]|nr:class I tRNA ligase family protein [Candidatus Elarobacter sp.]